MTVKEKIIKNLENELSSNEYYKKDIIYGLNRSDSQARDLLARIKNGEFDGILSSTSSVRLDYLSSYDLTRDKSTPPTTRDYRKYVFLKEIDDFIERINEDEGISDKEKEVEINKYKHFLGNLDTGVYDELLDEPSFWFADDIELSPLVFWDDLRSKGENCGDLTLSNYIVIETYYLIMSRIKRIAEKKETTGENMYIFSNGLEQSPATLEELEQLKVLGNEILSTNYDWREARNVERSFYALDIWNNGEFPHNVDDIRSVYTKKKNIVFDQYDANLGCCHNTDMIVERAKQLADELTPDNFLMLFFNKNEDDIATYLRKMIVSQIDSSFLENYEYSKDKIEYMLNNPSEFSEDELRRMFSSTIPLKRALKELYDIAYGTLYSLYGYKDSKINIFDDCVEFQKKLNCFYGTVTEYDFNSVALPNGRKLISMPAMDISDSYAKYQEEYDYYCRNHSSDLELVEGCTEVMGNVVTSQIFKEGNKRTARCLFNAMMISNGIVPPIIDFTKDKSKLWDDFACNRFVRYLPAKKTILDESIKTKEYFPTLEHLK